MLGIKFQYLLILVSHYKLRQKKEEEEVIFLKYNLQGTDLQGIEF